MIRAWIAQYELPILLALLALFTYFGYHARGIVEKAAESDQKTVVIEAIPKIITKTQTITKVIRDAKDKCADTDLPPAILGELRKQ